MRFPVISVQKEKPLVGFQFIDINRLQSVLRAPHIYDIDSTHAQQYFDFLKSTLQEKLCFYYVHVTEQKKVLHDLRNPSFFIELVLAGMPYLSTPTSFQSIHVPGKDRGFLYVVSYTYLLPYLGLTCWAIFYLLREKSIFEITS